LSLKNLSRYPQTVTYWNAYRVALIAVVIVAICVAFLTSPSIKGSFSLINQTKAAGESTDVPLVQSTNNELLTAVLHSDPSPDGTDTPLTDPSGSALVAQTGIDGVTSTSVTSEEDTNIQSGDISVYTVQKGDSLSEIADTFNISVNTILWANSIKDPKTVIPGTKLVILPVSGIQHTVVKGETVSSLSKRYTADADDIISFNGLENDAPLIVGSDIIIPGGEIPQAAKIKATKLTKDKTKKSKIKTGGSLSLLKNPYKGGSGADIDGDFGNPVPGAILTQGIHGWNGVDLGAPNGTPVYAVAGGVVIVSKVGGWNGGYGNYVVISHDNGTQTLYSHLSTDAVSVGETVSQGTQIGTVGKTGEATGFHLHFEVRGAKNPFAKCAEMTKCSM
jgi:murein DD-endopeptidase MepM/ murein hydrolase activator NlpD